MRLLRAVLACVPDPPYKMPDDEVLNYQVTTVKTALEAFKPTDAIEGILASQAVALSVAAMECLRRAMLPDQPVDIASRLRRDAANLMRTMTDMIDALDRKRGKGPQVIRVEQVVVQEGGQAIVGNVNPEQRGQ